MKKINKLIFATIIFLGSAAGLFAQDLPQRIAEDLKADSSENMAKKINKSNINDCYGDYSLLAQTVRYNKPKCFALLIKMGADVNKICNDYVPPLMHAVKYGRLEMVKVLIANGANVNYQYDGERAAIQGMTPLTYAEKYDQKEIVEYLKSLKK